jgi:peptidoglycan/LPS O-acetylase OafA/YrhL
MSNGRIHHVDVWRFIAIALVLVSHITVFSHSWYKTVVPGLIAPAQQLGLLGVRIFFCISGFVICRGMIRELEKFGSVSMRAFYIRRIYRILPAFVVYFLCVALMVSIGIFDIKLASFLKAGAFLCNFSQGPSCEWALGHTWSLAYEEQFYLIFPMFFVFFRLASNRIILLKIAAALLPIYILVFLLDSTSIRVYLGEAMYMLAGCLFALYWGKVEPVIQKLSTFAWCTAILAIVVLSTFHLPLVIQACYPFILALLICISVFGTPLQQGAIKAIFSNRAFSHLGRTSYSIYLFQQLATADYGFSTPIIAIFFIGVTIIFAHYSYTFFELPFVERGGRIAGQFTAPAPELSDKPEGLEEMQDTPLLN